VFDIAWSEFALIAAVALIVIGPKDLPKVMRNLGQWTRRARAIASEFQRNVDDMLREAELHDLKNEVESISPAGFKDKIEKMVDVKGMEEAMKISPDPVLSPLPVSTPTPELEVAPAPENPPKIAEPKI
jgi:sec-independent protein translocase protein TatB